ncbi:MULTISPECIES: hypothetical protein [unclassified Acinetobacter]|uniref:hypothetical protein n=1 Tax=unclassified Acinetobacter TaxID=196816 RepID=UPI0018AC4C24|nr:MULTISPECIES: hypothetical protein [unclassified Acinetobacter]MBJ9954340.1 hypothetical protein [Acinetobacter baumannii]
MKKLLFLAVLMGLTGCGDTDQNDTSQSTLQSSTASVNYRMAASSSALSAPSFGQWVVNGYASEGASTVVNASRMVGGVATESKALITPNVSQVSKILRAGLGGAALTFAVDELLDGIDWVMDPANNSVKFKTEIEGIKQYKGLGDSLFDTAEEYCSWRLNKVKSEAYPDSSLRNITISSNGTYGTCWIYTYSPVYAVDFGFDIIKIKKIEEKNLPFDVVSQEIINNAEIGNTDAQAVTLAAAQTMVSEAENDATKAKEIEDAFERNSDEKCKNHNLKMNSKAAMVEWRYEELYKDRFNLYINHKEVSNPFILNGNNKGSWDGHVSQYKYAQGVLRATIKTASNAGCPATPKANYWVNKEPPSQPGLHS